MRARQASGRRRRSRRAGGLGNRALARTGSRLCEEMRVSGRQNMRKQGRRTLRIGVGSGSAVVRLLDVGNAREVVHAAREVVSVPFFRAVHATLIRWSRTSATSVEEKVPRLTTRSSRHRPSASPSRCRSSPNSVHRRPPSRDAAAHRTHPVHPHQVRSSDSRSFRVQGGGPGPSVQRRSRLRRDGC